MLDWCSFSGWGREPDTTTFDLEGSQYLVCKWLQPIATLVTQDVLPKMVDSPLTLISWMGQWSGRLLFGKERIPASWLWIAPTTLPFNYHTYKTKNCWPSIDAYCNVQSIQDLLPLIIAIINIWTLWMPFNVIRTWLYGKAEPSNSPALVTLIRLKRIYLAK